MSIGFNEPFLQARRAAPIGDSPRAIAACLAHWARYSESGLARVDHTSVPAKNTSVPAKNLVVADLTKAGVQVREVFLEDTDLAPQLG